MPLVERLRVAVIDDARVELLITHVQHDEMSRASDPGDLARRELLRDLVVMTEIPTTGAVYDVSRYDEATYMSDAEVDAYETLTAGNPKHGEDALMALTASANDCILVTDDERLANRAGDLGVTTWSTQRFAEYVNRD